MTIANRPASSPFSPPFRYYDINVMLSAGVLSRIFLIALYFASGGPGLSATDLTTAIALP